MGLYLLVFAFINSGIISPICINPATLLGKRGKNRKRVTPGHRQKIQPNPEIWITGTNRANDWQESIDIKIMIDQKTPADPSVD